MQPLEEIYQSHARTVYHYLLSLTRDADLSEELTQEVFYQAVKNISRFDGSCKVSTWLCAIAKISCACTSENIHPTLSWNLPPQFPVPPNKTRWATLVPSSC